MALLFQYNENTANQVDVCAVLFQINGVLRRALCLCPCANKGNSFSSLLFVYDFIALNLPKILCIHQTSFEIWSAFVNLEVLCISILAICSIEFQQLLVRALFDDGSIRHDSDVFSCPNRGKLMGNDYRCAILRDPIERLLDDLFGLGIEGARGFIEEKYCRLGDDAACDGNSLLLSTRKIHGAFAELSVIALCKLAMIRSLNANTYFGKLGNKLISISIFACFLNQSTLLNFGQVCLICPK